MAKLPRTPEEIAAHLAKHKTTLNLKKENWLAITSAAKAAKVPVGELVDEAIEAYLETLKHRRKT